MLVQNAGQSPAVSRAASNVLRLILKTVYSTEVAKRPVESKIQQPRDIFARNVSGGSD